MRVKGKRVFRNEHYDLVSVLYHALQGAQACDRHASDAEAAGEEELAAFFRETQARLAERAKAMLGIGEAGGISSGGISGGVAPLRKRPSPIAPSPLYRPEPTVGSRPCGA